MPDEQGALWIPSPFYFPQRNGQHIRYIIIHGTAGGTSAQGIASWFQNPQAQAATHYIVGRDGEIVQCVDESDGSWSNGAVTDGHDPWWTQSLNPNLVTLSIEHVKPSTDNSDVLTPAQATASFTLIDHICARHGIPRRWADANGGITGHYSMDPVNRSLCPNTYPWDALFAFLNQHPQEPPPMSTLERLKAAGWKDDPAADKLIAPNGLYLVKGFRQAVINSAYYDPQDWPLELEHGADQMEVSNPAIEPGTQQMCRMTTWEWNAKRGVFRMWTGQEIIALRTLVQKHETVPVLPVSIYKDLTDATRLVESAVADLKSTLQQHQ